MDAGQAEGAVCVDPRYLVDADARHIAEVDMIFSYTSDSAQIFRRKVLLIIAFMSLPMFRSLRM